MCPSGGEWQLLLDRSRRDAVGYRRLRPDKASDMAFGGDDITAISEIERQK